MTRLRNRHSHRQPPIPITGLKVVPRGEVQTFMDFDEDTGQIIITVFPFQENMNLRYEFTDEGREALAQGQSPPVTPTPCHPTTRTTKR